MAKNDMTKKDMVHIVQGYYDALEEGKILGRKCTCCDHIEYPPYLCCNECGCLDTEWVDMTDMRGKVTQVLPTVGAFGDPDFRKVNGDYWAIGIQIPNVDHFCSSLIHINPDMLDAFEAKIESEDVYVKPYLIQDVDTKVVSWVLEDDDSEFNMDPIITAKWDDLEGYGDNTGTSAKAAAPAEEIDVASDPIAMTVIECAAIGYDVDAETLTMATDIREDLSNESMKMIVMISEIEEELGVTIEIQEAGNLNTLADFVNKVKELL